MAIPKEEQILSEIGRFVEVGRDAYLQEIGPRRAGRSYFISFGDHQVDMKAIWYGALEPKPADTPNSVTIAPILQAMGFQIEHLSQREATVVSALEEHKRAERSFWTRNSVVANKRKLKVNYRCEACDFYYPENYKNLGSKFLEAHHLKPFSTIRTQTTEVVGEDDIAALCASCHRMIHELARKIGQNPTLSEFKKNIIR